MTTITITSIAPREELVAQPGTGTENSQDQDQAGSPSPPKPRGGGPRTPEGRRASRADALKFGLMAKAIFPVELQVDIDLCIADLTAQFQPTTAYESDVVGELGRATAQLRLCEK